MMFTRNYVGGTPGPGGPHAQTTISNSTITNADEHPIRLSNNNTITGLLDNSNTNELDAGDCMSPAGGNGSPVCVDSATKAVINSTNANCDIYLWVDNAMTNGCPLYLDYAGYSGYRPFSDSPAMSMARVPRPKQPAMTTKKHGRT